MKAVLKKLAKSDLAWAVSYKLSRWLGNTNTGIQFHIIGNKQLKDARKFYAQNNNSKNPEVTEQFHKIGSVRKKEPYPQDLVDTIKTKFAALIEDEDNYICNVSADYKGPKDVRRVLKDPLKKLPELALLIDENVKSQIEDFYGANFQIRQVVAWRNYHVPDEFSHDEALSNFWHFDQISTALFQLFVNISDVTEKDGPFHAQPKERSDQLMKMGFNTRADYGIPLEELENTDYVLKHTGPAGTAMYCKTPICLHRADIPEKGHYRDIVSFHILPAKEAIKDDWAKDYKDTENMEY
ncbi:MAG: hypothetical protein H6868_08705 [Rhodospirillales bacterium]|nr:hypothetical protein [Rhodospirillales bacterium]